MVAYQQFEIVLIFLIPAVPINSADFQVILRYIDLLPKVQTGVDLLPGLSIWIEYRHFLPFLNGDKWKN